MDIRTVISFEVGGTTIPEIVHKVESILEELLEDKTGEWHVDLDVIGQEGTADESGPHYWSAQATARRWET